MDAIDQLIEDNSHFGRYQILQLFICFFVIFSAAAQNLSFIFTTQTPKFQCNGPLTTELSDVNLTHGCFKNNSCSSLQFSGTMKSVVTKYSLVCDRQYLVPLISTLYMVGFFWGSIIYGYVSDSFGRQKACFCSCLHTFIFAIASAFAPNYWVFVALRILTALGVSGQLSVCVTYTTECASSSSRAFYTTIALLPWSVVLFFQCLVSYYLHDQTYMYVICAPFSLFCIAMFFFCQESPRWLISQGRADDAKLVLEKIANINKKPIAIDLEEFREWVASRVASDKKAKKLVLLKELMVYPGMRRLSFSLWFIISIVALVYYGFFYGISSLHGLSIYSQVMIGAGLEFAIGLLFFPILKRFERLWLRFLFFIAVGSFTLVVCILIGDPSMALVVTVLCSIARPFGAYLFNIEVLYAVEMYPTTHRTLGLGSHHAAARIGNIVATQLVTLGMHWTPTPYVLITTGCVIVIVVSLFLPESKYNACPETITEAEEIFHNHCFYREQLCCQGRTEVAKNAAVQDVQLRF